MKSFSLSTGLFIPVSTVKICWVFLKQRSQNNYKQSNTPNREGNSSVIKYIAPLFRLNVFNFLFLFFLFLILRPTSGFFFSRLGKKLRKFIMWSAPYDVIDCSEISPDFFQ